MSKKAIFAIFSPISIAQMRYLTYFFLILASQLYGQNPFDQAVILFEDAQYEEAGSLFHSHLKNYPKDAKTREYLGDIAAYQKDWDGAIEWYGPLVEENDQSAPIIAVTHAGVIAERGSRIS